jgi:hypothetical protein
MQITEHGQRLPGEPKDGRTIHSRVNVMALGVSAIFFMTMTVVVARLVGARSLTELAGTRVALEFRYSSVSHMISFCDHWKQ